MAVRKVPNIGIDFQLLKLGIINKKTDIVNYRVISQNSDLWFQSGISDIVINSILDEDFCTEQTRIIFNRKSG